MAAAALPNWVMVDRFVYRRDDDKSFREDKRTSATSTTSTGAPFRVSFILAEPPTPSRLYVWWPEGPKRRLVCHLVAAHRDLVLLRLDSIALESTEEHPEPFQVMILHDYFVYIPDAPPSQPKLKRLPACTEEDSLFMGKPDLRPFEPHSVGLLRRGEEEFAVAYLTVSRSKRSVQAQLWVLRSSVSTRPSSSDDDVGDKWEIKRLPIQHLPDEYNDLYYWLSHEVVPFKDSLCWINYYRGILFCDGVFGDSPKVSYSRLPLDSFPRHPSRHTRKELYRGLCVTEDGHRLQFVDVARDDGAGIGPMAPSSTGFTITSWNARRLGNGATCWSTDATVKALELWDQNTPASLPRQVMMLPLLTMDKPDVAHLILYEWQDVVDKASLVTIDLTAKRVVGKVVPYINGEEDLSTDDADMVNLKPKNFAPFLPTEFSKFLNPGRLYNKAHSTVLRKGGSHG
ncbi:uncharacterized protein LOC133902858 [Phragmites australis]|uniref:uncharacterized protein LOC133902858 n=1 Tax=Phragmites australis TaxID=29695 RepID=UPI002D798008|nr:uncharacterized protein LOC133902858 [Phragmites australis]